MATTETFSLFPWRRMWNSRSISIAPIAMPLDGQWVRRNLNSFDIQAVRWINLFGEDPRPNRWLWLHFKYVYTGFGFDPGFSRCGSSRWTLNISIALTYWTMRTVRPTAMNDCKSFWHHEEFKFIKTSRLMWCNRTMSGARGQESVED